MKRQKKVLVFGSCGREYVLAKLFSESGYLVYWYPGNAGWRDIPNCQPPESGPASKLKDDVVSWCENQDLGLVVFGPEDPLVAGYVDACQKVGIPAFGSGRRAAQLEGSKAFAKGVMKVACIPTAAAKIFPHSQMKQALEYAQKHFAKSDEPLVIKADGLCGGKGVKICHNLAAAEAAIIWRQQRDGFGLAGSRILIEECLQPASGLKRGEFSMFFLVNGLEFLEAPDAMDYKPVGNYDQGENGGGSGSISPVPFMTDDIRQTVIRTILRPLLRELNRRGITYRGVLYLGLMMTNQGPKVLEFNCRFGDPELQAIMLRHQGGLVDVIVAIANGQSIAGIRPQWSRRPSVYVVMMSEGYPESPIKGDVITGIGAARNLGVTVVHAGTALGQSIFISNGGRVLGVGATGANLKQAQALAYRGVEQIQWDHEFHRTDIGTWT